MGSMLKFESERRELVRERRQARIERKAQRRQARERKHSELAAIAAVPSATQRAAQQPAATEHVTQPPPPPVVLIIDESREREDRVAITGSAPSPTPAVSITADAASAAATDPSEREHAPAAAATVRGKRAPGVARREREITAFVERRQGRRTLAREEARERIARSGEERAVCDALGALAHSQASPWSRQRERLSAAIAGGRIAEIGAAARAACRDAAGDAARTSRRAPDPELALVVAVAYAVIARAPWATVRGPRAERSRAVARRPQRAFWR